MSTFSIAVYFPFRRVRITRQSVAAQADLAMIDVVPDERFRPICHACGKPAGRIRQREVRAIRDLNFGPAKGSFARKSPPAIKGSGYVVDCLEAALWAFYTTDTFRDAILAAVNLGDDADTTAAVCGQIAGAHYGASGIPAEWLRRLAMRCEIESLGKGLISLW